MAKKSTKQSRRTKARKDRQRAAGTQQTNSPRLATYAPNMMDGATLAMAFGSVLATRHKRKG